MQQDEENQAAHFLKVPFQPLSPSLSNMWNVQTGEWSSKDLMYYCPAGIPPSLWSKAEASANYNECCLSGRRRVDRSNAEIPRRHVVGAC